MMRVLTKLVRGYRLAGPRSAYALEMLRESVREVDRERTLVRTFDGPRPVIVVLCGSTRFGTEFQAANLRETMAGRIVLTVGCDLHSDDELWSDKPAAEVEQLKTGLDELHKRKVDLADEVLILNLGGYIGASTRSELEYARARHKTIRYLEPVCASA